MRYKDCIVDYIRKNRGEKVNIIGAIDNIVDSYLDFVVQDNDLKLFDICMTPNLTQAQLDAFLAEFDIETVSAKKSVMLAYAMKNHPELDFGEHNGPRLKGLLNFQRFANLGLISHFTKIVRALNTVGIKPMIIKGGAMKHLRPELPRIMGDIDIVVASNREYLQAIQIITDLGYDYVDNEHAVDVHEKGKKKGLLDIHQFIELGVDYDHKFIAELFSRAQLCKVFSCDVYVPSFEDLAFISLMNMVKNLHDKTSMGGVIYTLIDYSWLKVNKSDFDFNRIVRDVEATDTSIQMMFAARFANRLVKGMFDEELASASNYTTQLENYFNREYFYQIYVHDIKYACKQIKLKSAFSGWNGFKTYVTNKIPHFFTKRIMKSQFLINLFLKFVH